jgi:hypothetical protein
MRDCQVAGPEGGARRRVGKLIVGDRIDTVGTARLGQGARPQVRLGRERHVACSTVDPPTGQSMPDDPHPPTPLPPTPLPPTPEDPQGVPPAIDDPRSPDAMPPVREPPGTAPPVVAAG